MRLAAPAHLVDVNRLGELAYVHAEPDGVRVGALARHAAVERDEAAAAVQPLLRQALRLVAPPANRNRGTIGGLPGHAAPTGGMAALPAGPRGPGNLAPAPPDRPGRGEVDAADFSVGPLESAVGAGELAVEAFSPAAPPGSGTAFLKVARRHGDYAVCGVAAVVTPSPDSVEARVGYVSMGPTPAVALLADVRPSGPPADPASWTEAAAGATGDLEPEADIHATADYRLHLARVLTARALAAAWSASAASGTEAA